MFVKNLCFDYDILESFHALFKSQDTLVVEQVAFNYFVQYSVI